MVLHGAISSFELSFWAITVAEIVWKSALIVSRHINELIKSR